MNSYITERKGYGMNTHWERTTQGIANQITRGESDKYRFVIKQTRLYWRS